ncbi:response regulator transcription factor [Streptomyces sp. Vc74B-19]|uniref:LuxR C-terminal-related transcriptional regulator n=1 Tax=unclassified Streptomyces TaxID=2593676 RepID=UPI001BFC45BD|nr:MULTISPECIES: response regulator transcription factor [unclassified Streptomyces]MBT3164289.1 response regulator transcription factor [Streptomyces sp. Vc74B-19]MCO4695558.1 response regulator transcription factor [Streptomyces sp. RO-S4]MDU0301736.1 response regulator transcription factor [Streptomyces sp. PAL114]
MIGVLVSHDDRLARAGLAAILDEASDLDVMDVCGGDEVTAAVRRWTPEVLVAALPASSDRVTLMMASLQHLGCPPKTVLLIPDTEGHVACEALRGGASAVLCPDGDPETLRNTISAVAAGNRVFTSTAIASLVGALDRAALPPDVHARAKALTAREAEVCTMLAAGLSNAEIGRSLLLSPATIKDHLSVIYGKLGTRNRVETAVLADRLGLSGCVTAMGTAERYRQVAAS